MKRPPLAGPLAASLAVHLLVIALYGSQTPAAAHRLAAASRLAVHLQPAVAAGRGHAPAPPAPALAKLPAMAGDGREPARFITPPDLSALEAIPVGVAGSVQLRLTISAAGTVEAVQVVRADPIPSALLDGLQAAMRRTRLVPARDAERAVRSELDLTIRYEPGIDLPD